jgi:site-specific DNA-cytosine methylase
MDLDIGFKRASLMPTVANEINRHYCAAIRHNKPVLVKKCGEPIIRKILAVRGENE